METYIQSAGKTQEHDYRWVKKTGDINDNVETPPFISEYIPGTTIKLFQLIDSEYFSIIVFRKKEDIILWVTGLEARDERVDFMNRQIRNSIFLKYSKEQEAEIRTLLIKALENKLDNIIDKNIHIGGKYGFNIDWKNIDLLLKTVKVNINNNLSSDFNNCKIGENSSKLRNELISELENNSLPDKQGLLILITTLKSESSLKATGVWRGLSDLVEYDNQFKQYDPQAQKKTKTSSIAIILIVIMAITVIVIIIKIAIPQKPQPQINPGSPKLEESTLEETSGNSLKKESTLIKLSSTCQNQKEMGYFLSPCSLNVKNN